MGTPQDQVVQPLQVTSIKAQFFEVPPAGSPGSHIGSSGDFPVLLSSQSPSSAASVIGSQAIHSLVGQPSPSSDKMLHQSTKLPGSSARTGSESIIYSKSGFSGLTVSLSSSSAAACGRCPHVHWICGFTAFAAASPHIK